MAYIDKTYYKTWEQFCDVRNWAVQCGRVTDDYGNTFCPADFLDRSMTKADFDKWCDELVKRAREQNILEDDYVEFPLWNTPTYFDIWLIRNCPINWIQERLKVQYASNGWTKQAFASVKTDYDSIKTRTSVYDTYERKFTTPGKLRFTINYKYNVRFKDDDIFWWIQILEDGGDDFWYNKDDDMWYSRYEPHESTSNTAHFKGNLNPRQLRHILKKWNLPSGCKIHFTGDYNRHIVKEFTVTIK